MQKSARLRLVAVVLVVSACFLALLTIAPAQPVQAHLYLAGPAPTPTPDPMDNNFDPGLAVGALFFLIIFFVIIVAVAALIVIVVALSVAAAVGLTLLGIISSSAVIGLVSRRPAPGFAALVLQICAAAGVVAGIGVAAVLHWTAGAPSTAGGVLLFGSISGLVGGLATGALVAVASLQVLGLLARLIRRLRQA